MHALALASLKTWNPIKDIYAGSRVPIPQNQQSTCRSRTAIIRCSVPMSELQCAYWKLTVAWHSVHRPGDIASILQTVHHIEQETVIATHTVSGNLENAWVEAGASWFLQT